MPTQAAHAYTVTEAAAIIGVSPSQVRNWCTQFTDYVSEQATPAPGQSRTLSTADVATLQRVKELRDEGTEYAAIPAQLAQLDPGELVPYVESASTVIDQASPQSPQAAIELFGAMENRFQQMQGQIDRLADALAEEERRSVSAVTMFGFGIMVGILLVALVFALFTFGAWMAG